MLLSNGIMVGAFQTFFYGEGLLAESMLAIWLHGTLEIWAIIVAGAAGLALGNSWLFPGYLFAHRFFPAGSQEGIENSCGNRSGIYHGGFYRRFPYASYRVSNGTPVRYHSAFTCIYYLLLYLFTK